METPQIEDSTERQSAFPIGPCMYVRGGGLWAKHMGSKWGANVNTLGGTPWEPKEHIENLLGTWKEHVENKGKMKRKLRHFLSAYWAFPLAAWNFYVTKLFVTIFWPRLIPPLWTGGTYLLWRVPITKPPPDLSMWCCAKTIFLSQTSTFWLFFMQFYSAGSHTEHSWGCCY